MYKKCQKQSIGWGSYGPHTQVKCQLKALTYGTCKRNIMYSQNEDMVNKPHSLNHIGKAPSEHSTCTSIKTPPKNLFLLCSYILSNGQLLYRSVWSVPPNARKRRPVYTTGRTGHGVCIRQVSPRTSFLSRHLSSICFIWSVKTCFLQRDVFEVLEQT